MATSLKDIPGANRARRPKRADRGLWDAPRRTTLDMTPSSLRLTPPKPRRTSNRRQIDFFLIVLVLAAITVAGWLGWSFWNATRVHVAAAGIDSGQPLTPDDAQALDIALGFESAGQLFRADLTLDGVPLLPALDPDGTATSVHVRPDELVEAGIVEQALAEGEHRIELAVARPFLGDSTFRWTYVVDSLAPKLELPATLDPVPIAAPVTISGAVEKGARLYLDHERIEARGDRFSVDFDTPPTGALAFTAVDEAGNRTTRHVVVPVSYPTGSHAVHVSSAAWANAELRAGIEALVDQRLIDTVELDLKDEGGTVGYASKVPKALEIGAVSSDYDLPETLAYFASKDIRVIGRIVAFRDPTFANAAWATGHRDQVIQNADGGMFSNYGGFTNFANPEVRAYNRAIALEAASLGVTDILWDYMRRPEGEPSTMVISGLEGESSDQITSFLADMQVRLRARGVYQGVSVFGIAAAAGDSIAQDVPSMGAVVDYLAPMVYPSHWGPGMYRVPSPIEQPYDIVNKSLADFQRVSKATGVRFLPWLQDFTLYGVPYGEAEVRAQIQAAKDLGIDGYLLWNPNVRYTSAALDPIPEV